MPNKSTIHDRDYHYDKSVAKVFGKTKMSMKNFFLKPITNLPKQKRATPDTVRHGSK